MIIQNTVYYRGLDFDEYLKLPGFSYSSLKGESIEPTAGMMLGTRVHQYLNEPDKFDWKQAETVLPIARALKSFCGDAFKVMEKEVAFTSEFVHNGMLLRYKGRADMIKIGSLVVDFKVLAGCLAYYIKTFGYNLQVSGYALAPSCSKGLIIAYNKSTKKIETKIIEPDASFWEYQCVHRGEPMN